MNWELQNTHTKKKKRKRRGKCNFCCFLHQLNHHCEAADSMITIGIVFCFYWYNIAITTTTSIALPPRYNHDQLSNQCFPYQINFNLFLFFIGLDGQLSTWLFCFENLAFWHVCCWLAVSQMTPFCCATLVEDTAFLEKKSGFVSRQLQTEIDLRVESSQQNNKK